MAKRFHSSLINLRSETYTIEVWDSAFGGASTTFNPGPDGFSLSYKGDNNERTGTVLASECSVAFRLETADHETFQTDIIGSKEGRFTLKITKGTGTPTLYWVGLILTDIGGYEEAYHPFFTLRAVDGLGLLKDIPYKNGASFFTGKESVKQHLINALTQLEHVDTHFATTERFLRIGVDWWEETMTNSTTNDPLALTYLDHATWYIYKKALQEARSCREVIDNIMRCFGARITMYEGVFWVEQITYRTAATIVLRSYDKAGTFLSSNNFSSANTINQTANGAIFTGGVYEFFAPLSEARHTFNVNLRQNHLAGQSFNSGVTSNVTVNRPIEANSGATTLRITGNISLSINNQSYSGNLTIPRFALFKCQLIVGSYYLKRTYTVQNYQVNFGAMSWEASANFFYLAVEMPNGVPSIGNTYNYAQFQDITTPPLPVGADSFQFGMTWELVTQADLANFLESFNFLNQWMEPYSYGNPALNDDVWEYSTLNPDVENTLIHETECLIGNSTDPNAVGALWVKPASTYILADDWGDGADTPDRDIEKLNIELVVGGQQTPIRRLSGTLYGPLVLMGRVSWQSATWLLLGGTYDAANSQMRGEWFEINYDGAGLSTSGPIRYKKQGIPGLPEAPPDSPGSSNTSGKSTYSLPSAAPGTLLYPVAQARTLDSVTAGVQTSIDVSVALADGDFYASDIIVILNPMTGFFEELTVDTTSVAFDTAIDVSGTLVGDYPPDSPIIKKPRIGTFSLPAGYTGAILRHNGIKWLPYGGTTDGSILTWDATNGWHEEELAPLTNSGFWKWNNAATAAATDPGSGYIAADTAAWSSAATIVISNLTNGGTDVSAILSQITSGDGIRVQDQDDSSKWIRWDITATGTAQGSTHYSFPVTLHSGGVTEPNNNQVCIVTLFMGGGAGGSGTVTSVGLTMPTAIFDVTGSPVTTSGTLAVTLDTQTANTVLAGPTTGAAAEPAFRALVAADVPAVNATAITGLTANQVLYGSGGGGIAQSANLTFDATTVTLTGRITQTTTGSFSGTNYVNSLQGTLTATANSTALVHSFSNAILVNDGTLTGNSLIGIESWARVTNSLSSASTLTAGVFLSSSNSANVSTLQSFSANMTEAYDAGSLNNRNAFRSNAYFSGAGTYHTAAGAYLDVQNTSSGRWATAYGVRANVANTQTAYGGEFNVTSARGTGNSQRGIRIFTDVSGSGVVVDNAYGVELRSSAAASGVITNYYGIYQNTVPSGATQTYFLYGSQSTAKSYFAGNVGIGSGTTTPAQTLHVAGTVRITGSDGTPTTIVGRDADGDISAITVSTGLTLSAGVLTASGSGGTVTSVGLTMPTGFSVSGSPVTTTGTLAVSTTLNGPLRGNGTGFTTGNTSLTSEVTGTLPVANGGTGLTALGTALQLIRVNAGATALEYFTPTYLTANQTITLSGDVTGSGSTAITTTIANDAVTFAKMQNIGTSKLLGRYTAATGDVQEITISTGLALDGSGNLTTTGGSGTVTSVGLTMPTGFSVSGSPVTTSGTLAVSTTLNGPLRGNGTGFTTGNTSLSSEVTGTLPAANGGTGQSTYTVGDILYASTTSALSKLADVATGNALISGGVGVAPAWGKIALTTHVSGTLPVANGGTGAATLASDSVLTGNGTSAIVAEAGLTFNSSGQLLIGTGTPAAFLNVFTGALSGTQEFIRCSGNISGNMIASVLNANNANTAANTLLQLSVGGTGGGDPLIQFTVSGSVTHAVGIDNSDIDKFKITPGQSLPGGVANRGLIITNAATSLVGINIDAPVQPLHVSGRGRADQWVMTNTNPTSSFGAGAGTGPTLGGLIGGANGFKLTFTTGTTPTAGGVIISITLPTAFPTLHMFAHSPGNVAACNEYAKFYTSAFSGSNITISANGTLTASTQYVLYYVGIGY